MTLGVHVPHEEAAESGATRRCARLRPERFVRLRRGPERWHAATSLVEMEVEEVMDEELNMDVGENGVQGRRRQRVLGENLEDRELRGEGWRTVSAREGRGVRMRTR